tara:strand:- start:587 stop:832 length:246 start_codon:yes stop_codon:yes gene_type:complete
MDPSLAKEIFIIIMPLSVLLIIISQCDCCRNKCRRNTSVDVQQIVVVATRVEQPLILVIAEPLSSREVERDNQPTVYAIAI